MIVIRTMEALHVDGCGLRSTLSRNPMSVSHRHSSDSLLTRTPNSPRRAAPHSVRPGGRASQA